MKQSMERLRSATGFVKLIDLPKNRSFYMYYASR